MQDAKRQRTLHECLVPTAAPLTPPTQSEAIARTPSDAPPRTAAEEPTDVLAAHVAALSRAALEALVLASVRDGVPIEAQALVPPAPSSRARGVQAVAAALADADVGPFARLADELVGEVLVHLPAVARHCFSRRVCKSFRALCAGLPWPSVVLQEKCMYRKRPDEVLWITPVADFAQIATFLGASGTALTTLSLTLKDAPSEAAAITTLIRAAPALTDLTLAGKKMSSHVTKPLLASNLPSTLRRFTFGWGAGTSETTLKLLGSCTQLEHLGVKNTLSLHAIKDLVRGWRKARGGGAPMLESLELDWHQAKQLPDLHLGALLPDLRQLTLRAFHDDIGGTPLHLPDDLRTVDVELIGTDSKLDTSAGGNGHQYRSADTAAIARHVLAACPRATTVTIGWHLNTKATEKKLAGALPLGNGLQRAPASLTDLTLVGVRVVEEALAPLLAPDGPALRKLTFRQCVVDAPRALQALRQRGVAVRKAPSTAEW